MTKRYKSRTEFDPTKQAHHTLDYVLRDEVGRATDPAPTPRRTRTSVAEESRARPILDTTSGRTRSRVLFFTTDTAHLDPESFASVTMQGHSAMFAEVHLVVLRTGKPLQRDVQRVSDRMWVYPITTTYWWWAPFAAKDVVDRHCVFINSFRPDMVVGLDPFTAGLAALLTARRHDRPVQVHVREDFTTPAFSKTHAHSWWRRRLARYVLARVSSVRAGSSKIKETLAALVPDQTDLQQVPSFFDVRSLAQASTAADLRDTFPGFRFIILYVGPLDSESKCYQAIDAARFAVRSPGIGLVVVGDGPARAEFQERTRLLGIPDRVVFVRSVPDTAAYLAGADVCLVPETTDAADETVLRAAAAGTPVIAAANQLREDLFVHGEQMFLPPVDDVPAVTHDLNQLINRTGLRTRFSSQAQDVVLNRLEQDPVAYHQAYRDSIETAMFLQE